MSNRDVYTAHDLQGRAYSSLYPASNLTWGADAWGANGDSAVYNYYQRDEAGRVRWLWGPPRMFGPATNCQYIGENFWSGGRLSARHTHSLARTEYEYDDYLRPHSMSVVGNAPLSGSLNGVSCPNADGNPQFSILSTSTDFTQAGDRTAFNWTAPFSSTQSFGYDGLHRLVDSSSSLPGISSVYTLDGVNNRTGVTVANPAPAVPTVYHYGTANENNEYDAITVTGGTGEVDRFGAFDYDANGNLIQRVRGNSGTTDDYSYDAFNRLVQVDRGNALISYIYDALGRMIERIEMTYDGSNWNLASDRESCPKRRGHRINPASSTPTRHTPSPPSRRRRA